MALPQDGQNANALATVKEVPTGKKLIFVDPTTNEGGIITLEDLTTQILKKLTSQTFALDQGTKTLPAALNELNSKTLSALRQVDGNVEDWNNIASPGIYSGNVSTSKNTPIEATIWINAFVVPSNGNLKYLTAYAITDKGIFFRSMNNGRWEAWLQIK